MFPREQELVSHYNANAAYYSPVTEKTVGPIFNQLTVKVEPGTWFDVGCGTGWFAGHMHYYGHTVLACDVSMVRLLQAMRTHPGPFYQCRDLYLAIQMCLFRVDHVSFWDVLEHLEEPKYAIEYAKKIVNRSIVATVPINMDYVAHLQVYRSFADIERELQPSRIHEMIFDKRPYALLEWYP